MRRDDEDGYAGYLFRRNSTSEFSPKRRVNGLLADLLEKEEEITMYKDRLKELETAFYYNLEIISERDLELGILEKQLNLESEQLRQVLQEKEELEDAMHAFDQKNVKKIHHLETVLHNKDRQIRALQEEKIRNVSTLKRISAESNDEWKKIIQLNVKFETEKKKLIQNYQEEIEDKERYYLLEIDKLTGKLQEVRLERNKAKKIEEENALLKLHLDNMEKQLRENECIRMKNLNSFGKFQMKANVDEEEHGPLSRKVTDRTIQAQPETADVETQTCQQNETEEFYKKRVAFLQEQNEVLKCVVKELKKNESRENRHIEASSDHCSDCKFTKLEIRAINDKFEGEIKSLKKILMEEKTQRAEEEIALQNLETSVTSLKAKILSEYQLSGKNRTENGPGTGDLEVIIQTQNQVSSLEETLTKKIDSLMSETQRERIKIHDKLDQIKRECLEKLQETLRQPECLPNGSGEPLLQKIRLEMAKLEDKIQTDMKNMVRNNKDTNKFDKNFTLGCSPDPLAGFPDVNYYDSLPLRTSLYQSMFYKNNDITLNSCLEPFKVHKNAAKLDNRVKKKSQPDSKITRWCPNEFSRGR